MQCSVNRSHLITTFLDGILLLSLICATCSMEHCNSIKTYSNGLVLRLQRHKKICSLERLLSTTNTYVQSRTKCNRASRLSKAGRLRHQVNGCLPRQHFHHHHHPHHFLPQNLFQILISEMLSNLAFGRIRKKL